MRKLLIPALILLLFALAAAQSNGSQWQAGTILNVSHHDPFQDQNGTYQYDMTVQVGDKVYVVLFDSPLDTELGRYKEGIEVTLSVGEKTVQLNDIMGRTHDCPILKVSPAPKGK